MTFGFLIPILLDNVSKTISIVYRFNRSPHIRPAEDGLYQSDSAQKDRDSWGHHQTYNKSLPKYYFKNSTIRI